MFQMFGRISPSDRFIPRRSDADLEASHYFLNEKPATPEYNSYKNSEYVDQAYLTWKQQLYGKRLWSLVAPKSQRILNIIETSQRKASNNNDTIKSQQWPVRARKKPLIGSPCMILDMPNLKKGLCQNVIDWSSEEYMASVYKNEVYFWHPVKYAPHQGTNTNYRVANCIRWNHSSTHLALALNKKGIAIWDNSKNLICKESLCCCSAMCTITSLAWSSNNLLISGCTLGYLCVWNLQLQHLKIVPCAHNKLIITISLSCKERYLATTSADFSVRIWIWPNLTEYFEITHRSPVRGISWHPWKDSLLAIGGYSNNSCLTLWNVNNHGAQIGYKAPPSGRSSVDALTWNPLTGELVVSYWEQSEHSNHTNGYSYLVVLSDLNTVVDSTDWHQGRVLYLMWGSDGTTLATAGTDESLCIWNFFGNSKDTVKIYENAKKKKKLSTNNLENLLLFGQTIR